jgi:pilus assembly protein CpaF
MEGDIVTLQDAFVFDYSAGVDAQGRLLGRPVATGIRPRFIDRFEDLGIHVSPAVFATPAGPGTSGPSGQGGPSGTGRHGGHAAPSGHGMA